MVHKKAGIYIEPGRKPWPHELRVGEILALNKHYVEFLTENRLPTADVRVDGIEYEIKSPERFNTNTLEHMLRNAIRRQAPNIIFDTARLRKVRDSQVQNFLKSQIYKNSRLKRIWLITKQGKIIDILKLI